MFMSPMEELDFLLACLFGLAIFPEVWGVRMDHVSSVFIFVSYDDFVCVAFVPSLMRWESNTSVYLVWSFSLPILLYIRRVQIAPNQVKMVLKVNSESDINPTLLNFIA